MQASHTLQKSTVFPWHGSCIHPLCLQSLHRTTGATSAGGVSSNAMITSGFDSLFCFRSHVPKLSLSIYSAIVSTSVHLRAAVVAVRRFYCVWFFAHITFVKNFYSICKIRCNHIFLFNPAPFPHLVILSHFSIWAGAEVSISIGLFANPAMQFMRAKLSHHHTPTCAQIFSSFLAASASCPTWYCVASL